MSSPLSSFAAVAGYQIVMYTVSSCGFLGKPLLTQDQLYLGGYLLTLTYAMTSQSGTIITIIRKALSYVYL
jgi:hypothetical protein